MLNNIVIGTLLPILLRNIVFEKYCLNLLNQCWGVDAFPTLGQYWLEIFRQI